VPLNQKDATLRWAKWATDAWVFLIGLNVGWQGPIRVWNLPPNELGDFLAGAFAPLAFLWIVVGYLMQSAELKQQKDEFEKLSRAANLRAEREEAEAQPLLLWESTYDCGPMIHFYFANYGSRVSEVTHEARSGFSRIEMHNASSLKNGEELTIQVPNGEKGWVKIAYTDLFQSRKHMWIFISTIPKFGKARKNRDPLIESEEEIRKWAPGYDSLLLLE